MRLWIPKKDTNREVRYFGIPRPGWGLLALTLLVSFLLHLGSYLNMAYISGRHVRQPISFPEKSQVQIKIVPKAAPEPQRIVEVKQTPTEKPENPRFKGAQDHKTAKETRVDNKQLRPKGADPGVVAPKGAAKKPQQQVEAKQKHNLEISSVAKDKFWQKKPQPRNKYEKLMPTPQELAGVMNAGYQDYIDEQIEIGDRVDINTSDYRYISYFTSMRKAIELVWNYPYEAVRRGLQGEVGLEFTIFKDGTVRGVKVIQSSGFDMLDRAIVDAIKLASPFSPLPDGFAKNKLVVTGSFRYVLTHYAGG